MSFGRRPSRAEKGRCWSYGFRLFSSRTLPAGQPSAQRRAQGATERVEQDQAPIAELGGHAGERIVPDEDIDDRDQAAHQDACVRHHFRPAGQHEHFRDADQKKVFKVFFVQSD